MARNVNLGGDVVRTARGVSPRAGVLLIGSAVCLGVALFTPDRVVQLTAVVVGVTFSAVVVMVRGLAAAAGLSERWAEARLGMLVGHDASPCFTTDEVGQIGYQNEAARTRFRAADGQTLVAALGDHFANPASVLYRLQSRATNQGAGREDVVTRRGHMRLSVHRIAPRRFLWRVEEFVERGAAGRGAETLSLPMMVANKAGVVLFSNEALRRLVGTRPKRLDRVFNTPSPRSGEEVHVAGAEGPVRAFLAEVEGPGERREIYLLPAPDLPGTNAVLTDFEHVPVALLNMRVDGGLRAANRAARALLGQEFQLAARFQDLFDGLGRPVPDWLADIASERLPAGSEVLRLRRDGGETFVQVTLRRVADNGRIGLLAVLHDATAMKTLEAQFVQSQKMQAIGQLAGGIAHDFNNLLTALSGHCDLLLLRRDPADPDFADLMQIHQNANRAAALVGQLLAFSRKQTLKPEIFGVQEILSDLAHLLNRLVGEKIRIELDHAADPISIRADKRQFEQVLMNLVVNARDAMPEGGVIRVETREAVLAEDMQRDRAVVPAGRYTIVRVTDVGTGIPQDLVDKIFEPFFTTKRVGEGTGLGLSTVYGIMKQSGGFVFVESEVGRGTAFELYFPGGHEQCPATTGPLATPDAPAIAWRDAATRRHDTGDGPLPQGIESGKAEADVPLVNLLRELQDDALRDHAAGRAEAGVDRVGPGAPPLAGAEAPLLSGAGTPLLAGGDALPLATEPEDPAETLAGPLAPLPATLASAEPPAPAGINAAPEAGSIRANGTRQGEGVVLLVEDEAPVRAFASRALRLRGYTVIEADSAESALEALRDPALDIDVFVTDVIMPGMDGPSWVRQALKDRPQVRVVFVSGYSEDSLAESRDRIPNAVFLPKPFSLNDLATTVRRQLLH